MSFLYFIKIWRQLIEFIRTDKLGKENEQIFIGTVWVGFGRWTNCLKVESICEWMIRAVWVFKGESKTKQLLAKHQSECSSWATAQRDLIGGEKMSDLQVEGWGCRQPRSVFEGDEGWVRRIQSRLTCQIIDSSPRVWTGKLETGLD